MADFLGFLVVVLAIAGVVISIVWLVLPFILIAKLNAIIEALHRLRPADGNPPAEAATTACPDDLNPFH